VCTCCPVAFRDFSRHASKSPFAAWLLQLFQKTWAQAAWSGRLGECAVKGPTAGCAEADCVQTGISKRTVACWSHRGARGRAFFPTSPGVRSLIKSVRLYSPCRSKMTLLTFCCAWPAAGGGSGSTKKTLSSTKILEIFQKMCVSGAENTQDYTRIFAKRRLRIFLIDCRWRRPREVGVPVLSDAQDSRDGLPSRPLNFCRNRSGFSNRVRSSGYRSRQPWRGAGGGRGSEG
jgi:hypothetical protein